MPIYRIGIYTRTLENEQSKSNPNAEKWLSMSEASKLTPYSAEYLSLLARKGKLVSKKIDNTWYTTKSVLEDYMRKQMIRAQVQNGHYSAIPTAQPSERAEAPLEALPTAAPASPEITKTESALPQIEKKNHLETSLSLKGVRSLHDDIREFMKREGLPLPRDNEAEHINKMMQGFKSPTDSSYDNRTIAPEYLPQVEKPENVILKAVETSHSKATKDVEHALERVLDKKLGKGFSLSKISIVPTKSIETVSRSKALIATSILCILILTVSPVPLVFSAFENGFDAVKSFVTDANTVMGFRPGTHANQILLLDQGGNIAIMGHIETGTQLMSRVADGTAPIVVDSKTMVKNLNAEYLNGASSTDFTLAFVTKNGAVTKENVHLDGNVEVGKTLLVRGAEKLLGALSVGGNLSVFGDAEFKQALSVLGPANFKGVLTAEGDINARKNIKLRGSLEAGGAVLASSASLGSLGVQGALTASGDVTLGGSDKTLLISGKNASLDKDGNAVFLGSISGNSLTLSGTATSSIAGPVVFSNAVSFEGDGAMTNFTFINATGTNATTTNFSANSGSFGSLMVSGDSTVTGNFTVGGDTATIGQLISTRVPTLAHTFTPWPSGTSNAADATIYINPATAAPDTNIFAAAVGGVVKFLVDAEGDLYAGNMILSGSVTQGETNIAGNLNVQDSTTLGDASTDLITLNGQLLALASTSLQDFTFRNATGTNATTTNLFSTTASSTNLFASLLNVGGRALAVDASGNVGMGIAIPAYKLDIVGPSVSAAGNSDVLRVGQGSDGGVNIILANNVGNLATITAGVTSAGAGTDDGILSFGTAANGTVSERMRITSTGNVGIGTTNPDSKLHIEGTGQVANFDGSNDTSAVYARFGSSAAASQGYIGVDSSTGGAIAVGSTAKAFVVSGSASGNPLQFATAGTVRATIDASGNVGIGTTNPLTKFVVNGGNIGAYSSAAATVGSPVGSSIYLGDANFPNPTYYNSAPGLSAVYSPNSLVGGDLAFYYYAGVANSRTEAMRISGGNVGIGVTNPTDKLAVTAGAITAGFSNNDKATLQGGSGFGALLRLYSAGATETVRMDGGGGGGTSWITSGNVGIGTTTPDSLLHVYGNSLKLQGSAPVLTIDSTGANQERVLYFRDAFGGSAKARIAASSPLYFGAAGFASEQMVLLSSGNVGIGTTNPAALLDVKGNGSTNIYRATDTSNQYRWRIDQFYGEFLTNAAGTDIMGLEQSKAWFNQGNVGIGTTNPTEKLVVAGNILSTGLTSAGNRCVYADSSGVLHIKADDCGLAGASGDNLGNHTATQNILLNGNWLSNDGGSEGLKVDNSGYVTASGKFIVGTFPNSTTNSGEAWFGRAADRTLGTYTLQLGGVSAANTSFEIVDRAWSKVIASISGEAPGGSLAVSSAGNVSTVGSMTSPNFRDALLDTNVNLGNAGSEGRGVVAGFSGGNYSGLGYNVRHTTSSGVYIAPGTDTSSYMRFDSGGFNFYGAAGGAAGRTLSYSTLFTISSSGGLGASTMSLSSTADPALAVGNGSTGYAKIGATTLYDDGTYFSPKGGRHFYIRRSDTPTTYIYSSNIYLGDGSSGTNVYFRDAALSGTSWSLTAAGAMVGTSFSNGSLYTSPTNANTLNSGYSTAADNADIWINYRGYNDAQAYFRDFRVGNGKGVQIAKFDGSTGNVSIGVAGAPEPAGQLDISKNPGNGYYDGIVIGQQQGDNTNTIQTYIDSGAGGGYGNWSYASGCCNPLNIQPYGGDLTLGNATRGVSVPGTLTAGSVNIDSASATGGYQLEGQTALTGYTGDQWLRLNQNNSFTSGVYTPGIFRVDGGIVSGAISSLGAGTIHASGEVRGSYFRDYDSTGYYLDPASDSNINTSIVAGGSSSNWASLDIGGAASINAAGDIYSYSDICAGNASGNCDVVGSGSVIKSNGDILANNVYTGFGTTYGLFGSRGRLDTLNSGSAGDALEFGYDVAGDFQLYGGDLTGVNNHYIYPARVDSTAVQKSWYLGSHASYGLYSNTGFYAAGGFSTTNGNVLPRTGSYGSLDVGGSVNGWSGLHFTDVATNGSILMVGNNNDSQGFYKEGVGWSWYFAGGVLTVGSVPWARVTGAPAFITDGNTGWDNVYGLVANGDSPSFANITVSGCIYYDNCLTKVDIAESFPVSGVVEAGDIVTLDTSASSSAVLKKSSNVGDTFIGIVSTAPAIIIEGDRTILSGASTTPPTGIYTDGEKAPIALAGRVPVKFSLENGPIKAGDHLTVSSTTPGKAVRITSAGMVVGEALEDADASTGTVLVFVSHYFYDPSGVDLAALERKVGEIDLRLATIEHLMASTTAFTISTSTPGFVSSVLATVGATVSNGLTHFGDIVVSALTVGSREKPTGVTFYDSVTGDPYCMKVSNGVQVTVAGDCSTPANASTYTPNPVAPPSGTGDASSTDASVSTTTPETSSSDSSTASTTPETATEPTPAEPAASSTPTVVATEPASGSSASSTEPVI